MQHRPDKTALLEAVARFLDKEVRPAVSDPSLAFRVLIAQNLCQLVSAEMQMEEVAEAAELDRLAALLPELDLELARGSREERTRALERANRELCARIEGGAVEVGPGSEVWEHVTTALRGELLTSSPRYDTSLDIA
jgi:flagella basal body P-ring formation protein FlgA